MTTQLIMSDIEKIVYDYLIRRGIQFRFQTAFAGGHFELGGTVVDFLLDDLNLAWRVQGEYYHRGVSVEGKDEIQKEMLTALGWVVVDLWSDDIFNQLEETMMKALRGEEML